MELVLLKVGELTQTHLNDCASLNLVKVETLSQALTCLVGGLTAADDVDNLINVVAGDNQTLEDVSTFLGFLKLKLSAANHHLMAMLQEVVEHVAQVHSLWASLHEANVVHAERRLQFGHLIELVEQHIGVEVLLHINNDAHTVTVALVVDVRNAVNSLVLDQTCDILDELSLIYIVRNLGNDDTVVPVLALDLGFRANHNAAFTSLKCIFHALISVDYTSSWEVGGNDVFHQALGVDVGILEHRKACINRLGEVVWRHVGCHTHSNTRATINQQVRESGWQHLGFLESVVEVWNKVHSVFVHVSHHLLSHLA